MENVTSIPEWPVLGMDLDGTIDAAQAFFSFRQGKVYVITYRDDQARAEAQADLMRSPLPGGVCL